MIINHGVTQSKLVNCRLFSLIESMLNDNVTGFNDALHSLTRLSSIDFRLPVDLAVRRFVSNQDLIE